MEHHPILMFNDAQLAPVDDVGPFVLAAKAFMGRYDFSA